MRGFRRLRPLLWFAFSPSLLACGYSQDEWDHKVRENEELRTELRDEKRDREKADADYADALDEIDALRAQLSEHGVSLDSMSESLEAQRRALEEYQKRTAQLVEIQKRFEALREKLKKLTNMGLTVEVRDNRMVIQLPGDVLFDSGSEKLREEGQEILLQVAEVIGGDTELSEREFQVAGHTDSRALQGGMYRDNWGLSAMRARSVLVLLTTPKDEGGGGLNPTHWSAAGYGDTRPVDDNATDEGRERNRRVELVVQPDVQEMISLDSIAQDSDDQRRTAPAGSSE